MVCCTSWTPVEGEGHGATCSPLQCWRTAYLQPRYAGGMILRCRMKATCSRPLPAMNGLLVIYFWVFLPDNELENGYEGFVAAEFECRFFFLTDGVEELQALADVIAGEGRSFSHPKRGCREDKFYSCGGGRHHWGECAGSPLYFLYCFAATTGSDRQPH
ncbi:hypothetical protein TcG_09556 [Trypanosoma cruzi]|nr:hypothetical protein TcG_09556 [Trypanosoma cruzi]